MVSIEKNILDAISMNKRGKIYFPVDFFNFGEPKAVGKALERLVISGQIIRLSRGIYCYPKIDKKLGLGVLYPSIEEIANAIARRDKTRIAPTGIQALNKLGLSTQVPMNVVYMTDGTNRKVNLGNGRSIQFKYTSPGNFAFTNKLAMLVTFALKEIGRDNVTESQFEIIKNVLIKETKEKVLADLSLMPVWIRSIIKSAYE